MTKGILEILEIKVTKGDLGDKGEIGDKGEKGDIGDTGLKGDKGDIGDKGEKGEIGPAGPSAMIAYSTGPTAVALATVLAGGIASTGATYDFGVSNPSISLVGINLDFTGALGGLLPNMAWSIPRDGTITSLATAFQNSVAIAVVLLADVFLRTQLYLETAASPGVFVPIASAIVEIQIPSIGIAIGETLRGITTGLNVSVAAGDRLVIFANTRTTGGISVTAITGFISSGVAIS